MELLYPSWHKVHFKMKYLYFALALSWIVGIVDIVAHIIPTSKVRILVTDIVSWLDSVAKVSGDLPTGLRG